MTNEEILNIELVGHPGGTKTIREAFAFIAADVWREGEGFSGKRALGNSIWQNDIYLSLVKAGAVKGLLDEYGDLDECDYDAADELVLDAIMSMASERRPDPKRIFVRFRARDGSPIDIDPMCVSAITTYTNSGQNQCSLVRTKSDSEEGGYVVTCSIDEAEKALGIETIESCPKA
jgi:hypothetical protein